MSERSGIGFAGLRYHVEAYTAVGPSDGKRKGMFFVWTVILLTHIAFRRSLGAGRIARLPLRLRFYPYSTLLGIAALLGITLGTFFVEGL